MAYFQDNMNPYMTNPTIPQMRLFRVPGINEARKFQIQPGTTVYLLDENSPYMYLKSMDASGNSSLRAFQITEVNIEKLEDNEKYLTKKDLEAFKTDLLNTLLGATNNESNVK